MRRDGIFSLWKSLVTGWSAGGLRRTGSGCDGKEKLSKKYLALSLHYTTICPSFALVHIMRLIIYGYTNTLCPNRTLHKIKVPKGGFRSDAMKQASSNRGPQSSSGPRDIKTTVAPFYSYYSLK